MRRLTVLALALAFAAYAGPAAAEMTHEGHGAMSGMSAEKKAAGHDMTKMGDKVYSGKIGPWHGTARLMDMKAHMEKAMSEGMKMEGMTQTHHIALVIADPKTKKPVTEGTGSVTVTGPDKKAVKSGFMAMQGHFGADVTLPAPGKYTFKVEIESCGQKGTADFSKTIK